MKKYLRRKGQGETQRPICSQCEQDLKRSYTRKKGEFVPNGWECVECRFKQWD